MTDPVALNDIVTFFCYTVSVVTDSEVTSMCQLNIKDFSEDISVYQMIFDISDICPGSGDFCKPSL